MRRPPNIIIGTSLGLSFFDFLGNTGVIAAVCLVFTVVYFFLCFRKPLAQSEKNRPADVVYPDAASAVTNRAGFYGCGASFLVVVVLLITHAQTELTVATIGCIAAALMSLVTLLTSGRKAAAGLFARVDYKTLLFFTGLFVVVAGLERTGCLAVLADGSATPIGASANVVGTSVAAKNGHPVTWGKYCRYCAPATIMVMAVSMVCIVVRYM